jgi:hypothetical protein
LYIFFLSWQLCSSSFSLFSILTRNELFSMDSRAHCAHIVCENVDYFVFFYIMFSFSLFYTWRIDECVFS